MLQLKSKATDLDRFIYLINLLDANETLFYRTLMSDPARFLEIVYDPTIAEACLKFDHIFRRPRGMYLSISRKDGRFDRIPWTRPNELGSLPIPRRLLRQSERPKTWQIFPTERPSDGPPQNLS